MAYGNYPEANKYIRLVNCFQQVTHQEAGWNTGYCLQLMIIGTLCFVNFVVLLYLLVLDIQNRRLRSLTDGSNDHYLAKPKSWILILGVTMNLIQFVRYFIQPEVLGNFVFNGSLYLCEALKYAVFMLIFYYFLKKAASLLSKEVVLRWTRMIWIITGVSTAVYLVFGIEFSVVKINNNKSPNADPKGFCKSPQFIIGGILQLIQTSCFIGLSWKIEKAVREQNDKIIVKMQDF